MPIGYLWTVALVSWGVACALTRWHRLGSFSAIPALVVSELPFIAGYLLIASTMRYRAYRHGRVRPRQPLL